MSQTPWPLGFRFHPTDEEIINHYLKRKIAGTIDPRDAAVVPEIDVCRFEPWDLPDKSPIESSDPEWFFFAPVDRKYPSGNRSNRATKAGFWKATGSHRQIRSRIGGEPVVVGMKKSLVFHRGRSPNGVRTNWVMHEYLMVEPESGSDQGGFVLCRLFRKPEERVSGVVRNEPENSRGIHRADDVEEGFVMQPNQQSPQSELQVESHPLPDTINKQPADIKLTDETQSDSSIPFPLIPEESHNNSNMSTKAGIPVEEGLYDNLEDFLGSGFEHLFYEEFPQINPRTLASADDTFNYGSHDGTHTQIQFPMLERDSDTKALDGVLSMLEEYPAAVSNYQSGSGVNVIPQDHIFMSEQGSTSDSTMNEDIGFEAPLAQHEQETISHGCGSLHIDNSSRYNETDPSLEVVRSRSMNKFLFRRKARLLKNEELSGLANSIGTGISIQNRNPTNLESSIDFTTQQGSTERSIRLQSSKHREIIRERARMRIFYCPPPPCRCLPWAKSLGAKPTDNNPIDDFELISTDNGGAAKEPEETNLRLRTRHKDEADGKLENSSLLQEEPRASSVSTHKIGVAMMVIASVLCAGTIWFLNS